MSNIVDEIYTPFSILTEELNRRRNDPILLQKVMSLFDTSLPIAFQSTPLAMLSRSIATPNREMDYFIDLAKSIQFNPTVLEYNGKLVAKNPEKYFLCKLHFYHDYEKKDYKIKNVINFNASEGKYMHEIETIHGTNLRDIHQALLQAAGYDALIQKCDITEWFNSVRSTGEDYYFHFLSLCIVHGVLFENYLFSDKSEQLFFQEKILPSFRKVSRYFGVKPLIFPLLPLTTENRNEWLYYRKDFEHVIH